MDAQDLELKSLKSEIAALRADLANMKEKESKTLKDKDQLEDVLTAALAKLYPEKYENEPKVNFNCLTTYLQENNM